MKGWVSKVKNQLHQDILYSKIKKKQENYFVTFSTMWYGSRSFLEPCF